MGMGIGKQYWVHVLDWHFGTLEECIKFMEENKPDNDLSWFELEPIIKVDRKNGSRVKEYRVQLVEED